MQGRLTKDEFDSRVGDVLASRTYADLVALTADLPAGPPPAKRPRQPIPARPRRSENSTVRSGVRVIAATTVLAGGVWAGALLSNTDNQVVGALAMSFTFLWFGIVLMIGAIMLESLHQQRSGGQLPPAGALAVKPRNARYPLTRPDSFGPATVVDGAMPPKPPGVLFPVRRSF